MKIIINLIAIVTKHTNMKIEEKWEDGGGGMHSFAVCYVSKIFIINSEIHGNVLLFFVKIPIFK